MCRLDIYQRTSSVVSASGIPGSQLTTLGRFQTTVQLDRRLDQLVHDGLLPLLTEFRHHRLLGSFFLLRSNGCDRFPNGLQPCLSFVVGPGELVSEKGGDLFDLCKTV